MEHSRFGVTWRWHQQPQQGLGGTFFRDFLGFGKGGGGWAGIAGARAVVMRRWRAEAAPTRVQRLAPPRPRAGDGAAPHVRNQYGKNMIKHVLKHHAAFFVAAAPRPSAFIMPSEIL